jgi:hypothetical protein
VRARDAHGRNGVRNNPGRMILKSGHRFSDKIMRAVNVG